MSFRVVNACYGCKLIVTIRFITNINTLIFRQSITPHKNNIIFDNIFLSTTI